MDTQDVVSAAREVGDHPVVEGGARLGYAVNGVVHLLIAWLGIQVAFGQSSTNADQSGALATVAERSGGRLLLWVAVAGFALLAMWQLTEAVVRRKLSVRVKSVSKGLLYLALAWSAFGFTQGAGKDSEQQSVDFTAELMRRPAGQWLVAAVGVGILGVAGYHVVKGWRKRFLEDLREHPGGWAVRAGQVGYIAKGIALGFVAALFIGAAWAQSPKNATGLDGALHTMLAAPLGQGLLLLVSAGFAAYALYSFARSRYAKV